jgi:two-component system, OmpR family, phosphate regulon sensor histidine kinase PhoR
LSLEPERSLPEVVRQTTRFALPAGIGVVVAWLVPADMGVLRLGAGAGATLVVAAWLALRRSRRLTGLRQWLQRVRAGESVSPPLPAREPDELDRLSADLGGLVGGLGEEVFRLENERDRLEAILAAMVEGVIVIDGHGTILRANERALETFGLAATPDLVGRRLWDLSRDSEFNAVVRDALAGGVPAFREVELRGAIHRFLRVTVGPTADGSAWVLVFHDVTETKHLERVRTDFVANVSHELRTPLTAIKGFAETLLSSGLADGGRAERFLTIIDRQAERLSRLIDDLLILSDLELGRSPLRIRPVGLQQTIREVAELLSGQARRGQVAVRIEIASELEVASDPDRLAQVVTNLLENGIKYTPPGGSVTVTAEPSSELGLVEIAVADTGCGIPAEDLPRVTERFYRVDKARSREFGGTGLGLSIVKHIVQAHGGRLGIESRVGVGTTVRVTLPRDGSLEAAGDLLGASEASGRGRP